MSTAAQEQNNTVADIARNILKLDTLEVRNSDSKDFHDLGVWDIEAALKAAYTAGFSNGYRRGLDDSGR